MILSSLKRLFNFSKLIKSTKTNKQTPANIKNKTSLQPTQKQQNLGSVSLSPFYKLSLKQFALETKEANLSKNYDELYWHEVGQQFLQRLQTTTNPQKIRSYSVILYHLSKSKSPVSISNFQVPFSMMLPFSTPQSFASIVSSLSRMGSFNNQFSMIVRKNYQNKKHQLGIREKVTINYSMVRNGDVMDAELLKCFNEMNLKQIVSTFRMADQSNLITQDVLKNVCKHIMLKKREINILDFSHCLQLLGKHDYLPKEVQQAFLYAYKYIKRNMDAGAIEKVWKHFPHLVNNNLLTIDLTQQIILTLRMLYKKGDLSEQFIREVRRSLNKIQNIQIRLRCQLK